MYSYNFGLLAQRFTSYAFVCTLRYRTYRTIVHAHGTWHTCDTCRNVMLRTTCICTNFSAGVFASIEISGPLHKHCFGHDVILYATYRTVQAESTAWLYSCLGPQKHNIKTQANVSRQELQNIQLYSDLVMVLLHVFGIFPPVFNYFEVFLGPVSFPSVYRTLIKKWTYH